MELTSTTLNPILLAKAGEERFRKSGGDPAASDLARRAAEGSIEAFEELAIQFEPRIYGFLARRLGNAHDAQDLTQETFVRAWRNIARFDPTRNFATWLFVIARRAAANHFRSRRIHDELSEDFIAQTPETGAADAEGLWRAAKKLKPSHYEVLWLRYAENFSVAETAKVMGLTAIHVKVILHRARKELARRLNRENL